MVEGMADLMWAALVCEAGWIDTYDPGQPSD